MKKIKITKRRGKKKNFGKKKPQVAKRRVRAGEKKKQPEKISYYPDIIEVRANWELEQSFVITE